MDINTYRTDIVKEIESLKQQWIHVQEHADMRASRDKERGRGDGKPKWDWTYQATLFGKESVFALFEIQDICFPRAMEWIENDFPEITKYLLPFMTRKRFNLDHDSHTLKHDLQHSGCGWPRNWTIKFVLAMFDVPAKYRDFRWKWTYPISEKYKRAISIRHRETHH